MNLQDAMLEAIKCKLDREIMALASEWHPVSIERVIDTRPFEEWHADAWEELYRKREPFTSLLKDLGVL